MSLRTTLMRALNFQDVQEKLRGLDGRISCDDCKSRDTSIWGVIDWRLGTMVSEVATAFLCRNFTQLS
jgi:hypothetical protein